jgi:hypothetical protein
VTALTREAFDDDALDGFDAHLLRRACCSA